VDGFASANTDEGGNLVCLNSRSFLDITSSPPMAGCHEVTGRVGIKTQVQNILRLIWNQNIVPDG